MASYSPQNLSIFLLLTCLMLLTDCSPTSASSRAVAWLNSQSLPSGGWRDEQTGAAILGIMAYNPLWYVAGADNDPLAELAVKQLEVEVLAKATTGKLEAEVTAGQLAQYLGALQVTCRSTSDLHGFNLKSVAESRLAPLLSRGSPAGASLAIAVCNAGTIFTDEWVDQLDPGLSSDGNAPFGVEKAALAVVALMCVSRQRQPGFRGKLNVIIRKSGEYISDRQQSDGGFGSVFSTSLALQANAAAPRRVSIDKAGALSYLVEHIGEEGGYGTPLITALALPALAGRSMLDIGKLECVEGREEKRVFFVIADTVFTESSLKGSFPFEVGKTLLEAFQEFSDENPGALTVETQESPLGVRMVAINQIKNDAANRLYWSVRKRWREGGETDVLIGLEKVTPSPGDTYIFTYGRITLG